MGRDCSTVPMLAAQEQGIVKATEWVRSGQEPGILIQGDVGTGKTRMGIEIMARLAPWLKERLCWFISSKNAKLQQLEQLHKWDPRNLDRFSVLYVDGTAEERAQQIRMVPMLREGLGIKWVILHYESLKSNLLDVLAAIERGTDWVLVDEIHKVQNVSSSRSKATRAVCAVAGGRIGLSATTISNTMESAYAVFQCVTPAWIEATRTTIDSVEMTIPLPTRSSVWGSQQSFNDTFVMYLDGKPRGIRNKPEFDRKLAQMCTIVITHDDVGIRAADPFTHYLGLTGSQEWIYASFRQDTHDWLWDLAEDWRHMDASERAKSRGNLLGRVQLARHISACSGRAFVEHWVEAHGRDAVAPGTTKKPDGHIRVNFAGMDVDDANAKADWAIQFLQEHADEYARPGGGGAYVYCEFKTAIKELWRKLGDVGKQLNARMLTGDTRKEDREITRHLVLQEKCKLVLATDAGGESLNLQKLSDASVWSPNWTHTKGQQATGRITRLGQANDTSAHFLLMNGTIEVKKIMPIAAGKGKVAYRAYSDAKKGYSEKSFWDFEYPDEVMEWF